MGDLQKTLNGLSYANIVIGILVGILQTCFFILNYGGSVVWACSGYWGGVFFVATGSMVLRRASRNSIMIMASCSLGTAFGMMCLFSWGINDFVMWGGCYYMCDALAIEIIFLISSVIAIIINLAIIAKARSLPTLIVRTGYPATNVNTAPANIVYVQSGQTAYGYPNQQVITTTTTVPNQTVYQIAPPSYQPTQVSYPPPPQYPPTQVSYPPSQYQQSAPAY